MATYLYQRFIIAFFKRKACPHSRFQQDNLFNLCNMSPVYMYVFTQESQAALDVANAATQNLEGQLAEIQSEKEQLKEQLQEMDKDRSVSPTENVSFLSRGLLIDVSTLQIVLEDKSLISRRLSCLCLHAGLKWSLTRHQSSREEIRGSTCRDTERKRTAQGTAARSGQRSKCKSIRQKMSPFYFKVF